MSHSKAFLTFGFLFAVVVVAPSQKQSKTPEPKAAQATSSDDKDVHEMLFTNAGLLAFDTPKDWERSEGPGFASFVPKGSDARTSDALIYISGARIGSDQEDKTLSAYVQSDISGFKSRFQKGDVHQEQAILLPVSKMEVPVYTFKSGEEEHNAIEQVAYIQDTAERVLTVVLSAKTDTAFNKSLPAFQSLVKSFRGSIVLTSDHATK
jgi:hypothetical protein